jgi:hypothetical protein
VPGLYPSAFSHFPGINEAGFRIDNDQSPRNFLSAGVDRHERMEALVGGPLGDESRDLVGPEAKAGLSHAEAAGIIWMRQPAAVTVWLFRTGNQDGKRLGSLTPSSARSALRHRR